MKKLTKTLSLVLVVAMVLSLCVIGAGATFTDNDKVTKDYSEAVGIMTDLGCVSGVGNNTFAPTGTLTRAQAAVILTRLTLGANADAYVPSKVTFKDVPASFWGYKFVEYAAQSGYVAGVGNGNYNPNATLTGYQWAAMLMKVLNIAVPTTGSDWQINTAKAYYGADKFSRVTISAANITREAATKIAYDALFYATDATTGYAITKTTYTDNTHTVVDDSIESNPVVVGYYDTYTAAAAQAAMLDAIDANDEVTYVAGSATVPVNTGTNLAKTIFNVTKTATTGTVATFGRPGTVYSTSKANAAVYGWSAKTYDKFFANVPVETYTAATASGKVYTDLGLAATTSVATYNAVAATNATFSAAKGDTTNYLGGNGIVTEIYNIGTTTAPSYKAVVIPTTFEQVIVASVAATKTHGAYTSYKLASGTYKVFSSVIDADNDVNTAVVTGTVATGDYVVGYVVNGTAYITAPTTVTGVLSAKTATTNVLTIGGKAYGLSSAVNAAVPSVSTASQTFYLDAYGYVLAAKNASTAETDVLVIKTGTAYKLVGTTLVPTYYATVVYADGTVATLDSYANTAATAKTKDVGADNEGTLMSVTKGVNGYVFGVATATQSKPSGIPGYVTLATGYTQKDNTLKAQGLLANANTLFVYTGYEIDGTTVSGSVTTATGIANVKSVTGSDLKIYAQDTDYDGIANVVWVYPNVNGTSVTSYIYVKDVNYVDGGAFNYTYNVVTGGKDTTLTVSKTGVLEANTLYYSITDNGAGTVTAVKAADNTDHVVKGTTSVQNKGGLLFVDNSYENIACAGTVPVYAIDTYDDTCVSSTFADQTVALDGTVYVVTDDADTTVLAIYVVYTTGA